MTVPTLLSYPEIGDQKCREVLFTLPGREGLVFQSLFCHNWYFYKIQNHTLLCCSYVKLLKQYPNTYSYCCTHLISKHSPVDHTLHNTHSEDHSFRDHFQPGGSRPLCFYSLSAKVVLPLFHLVRFPGARPFGLGSPPENPVCRMLVLIPKWFPRLCSCLLSQSQLSIQQPGECLQSL